MVTREPPQKPIRSAWILPQQNEVFINTNGSAQNYSVAMGVVDRDCNELLSATFGTIRSGSSHESKIWALRHGINLANSIETFNVTFWTDSTIMCEQISEESTT